MYTTSNDFKTAINNPSRKFECKVMCSSKTYTNVNIVSINITGSLQPSGYTIGSAISQKATFKFINDGTVTFPSDTISLQIGLLVNGSYEYVPIGSYTIDSHDSDDYTITITAYDNMTKLEDKYNGTGTTLQAIAQEICTSCGVTLGSTIPTTTVTTLQSDKYTNREVIGYVAGCMCGNAVIDREGKLKIQKLNLSTIDKQITTDNWFTYKNADMTFDIEEIICDTGNTKITSGSTTDKEKQLTIKNPLMTQDMLNTVLTTISNLTFTGFNIKYQGDISVDLGDTVKITDRKGQTLTAPLLQKTINYNGGLTENIKTEGKKKTDFASSYYYSNGRYSLDLDKFKYDFEKYRLNMDSQLIDYDDRITAIENEASIDTDESVFVIDTTLTAKTNKTVTVYGTGTTDWGDGTVDTETSHTYSADGVYTIKTPYYIVRTTLIEEILTKILNISEKNTSIDYRNCKNLNYVGDLLTCTSASFEKCTSLLHPGNIRDLTNASCMYKGCTSLLDTGRFTNSIKQAISMFEGCENLEYIETLNEEIQQADNMFKGCKKIKEFYLPRDLISANSMYQACESLESSATIVIPANLKYADYLFYPAKSNSFSLKITGAVDFSRNDVLENGKCMFANSSIKKCNILPNSLLNAANMFYYCKDCNFTFANLPPKLENADSMFANSSITSAYPIPSTVTSCAGMYENTNITNAVKIGENVTNCEMMYKNCYDLTIAPQNVAESNATSVDCSNMFLNCEKLTSKINIYSNIKADNMFTYCTSMTEMGIIEEGVVELKCTYANSGLTTYSLLPESLTSLYRAFYKTHVQSTINQDLTNVTTVYEAYRSCSELTTLSSLFESVLNRDGVNTQDVFYGCTNLNNYNELIDEHPSWF